MLEFSISNQLLSRLDGAKVVADSENYLECGFQFSEDWTGTVAVATFGHSKVKEPISVRIIEGRCRVPHEVIQPYGFQLSVYGTVEEDGGEMCHIPTNVVTVEVEASGVSQRLAPAEPTQSLYDALLKTLAASEEGAAASAVSARSSAEAAAGAERSAAGERERAEKAAEKALISATSCAKDAQEGREARDSSVNLREQLTALVEINRGYVMGGDEERELLRLEDINWKNGAYDTNWLGLEPGKRYRVRVNDIWYDVAPRWELSRRSVTKLDDQAELASLGGDDGEEKPEVPGGEEVIQPGGDGEGGDDIPVVKPTVDYQVVRNTVVLEAGPVTVEDVYRDRTQNEQFVCHVRCQDTTVEAVEVRTAGDLCARYFYEQALAAARRAEEALEKIEGLVK